MRRSLLKSTPLVFWAICLATACASNAPQSAATADASEGTHTEGTSDASVAPVSAVDASTHDAQADAATEGTTMLDIPPREQWPNDGGYCGETSLQSIALLYGAWISQDVVRKVAGGEMLLGVNDAKALDALHFTYVLWNSESSAPQFQGFAAWLKGNLARQTPAIFSVYLTDGTNDPDYDHIMVATGATYRNADVYSASDTIFFNNNFGSALSRELGAFSATRASCSKDSLVGGCIPESVDYGVAVTGIVDPSKATRPVSISVAKNSEPNVSKGAAAESMMATGKAAGLTAGTAYALLRYDGYKKVPAGNASEILAAPNTSRVDFTATASEWTFSDPTPFDSDSAVYYRCVPR